MNKILNWTFGSVFRTFGRIFAYLIIGALFGLFMSKSGLKITDLFGIDTISASTISIGTPKGWNAQWERCTNNSCNPEGIYLSTGLTDFGTSASIGGQDYDFVINNAIVVSYNFNSNNSYQLTYRIHFGGNSDRVQLINDYKYYNAWSFQVLGYKNNDYSEDYIKASSCSVRFDNSTSNGFLVSCNITLNENVTRINIKTDYFGKPNKPGISTYKFTSIRNNFISAQEFEGQQSIFDNQTNQIINNNNTNTNEIINNQNKNTQDIINNQNELLGDKCNNILQMNKFNKVDTSDTINSINNSTGTIDFNVGTTWGGIISDYIDVNSNTRYYLKGNIEGSQHFLTTILMYNSSKTLISDTTQQGDNITFNFDTTSNTKYIKIRITTTYLEHYKFSKFTLNDDNKSFCEYGKYQSKLDSTNNSINDLKNSVLDSSSPSLSGLDNSTVAGWLPPGPVDSILNLPLTFLNSLINGMSGSCSPLRVPLPYVNVELPIPCMSSVYNQMGFGSFFNWVGNIAAAFILFKYLIYLYKYVDDTLTFRENNFIDNWSGV